MNITKSLHYTHDGQVIYKFSLKDDIYIWISQNFSPILDFYVIK